MTPRTATIERTTRETRIRATVNLDGEGRPSISTGLGFLDHMLTTLALHSRIDIDLRCTGDLQVDDHHSVEDCAITLGQAIAQALGDRAGAARFGWAFAPLDESLARAVVDLSGRPFAVINLNLRGERLGDVSCENLPHFFMSLATSMQAALHLDVERGGNDHHRAESAFKACALALRQAVHRDESDRIASTKGVLT